MANRIDALVDAMEPSQLRSLGDGAPGVSKRRQLPGCDHAMLPRRQLGERSKPNLSSFVAHRATKDAGLGFSPPSKGTTAQSAGFARR
jgi:hypothetical protein